ncbi:MAG: radical SAM protein [Acidobacteriota bacterium]
MRILGNPYLDFAARRALSAALGDDAARADGRCRLPPEWLVLGVNNACDLACKMCDVGLGDEATVFWANLIGDHPRNMSIELLESILAQGKAFRPRPKVGFAFTEPLIHKGIVEMCARTVASGYFASVTSNGTMLPRLADDLVDAGLDQLVISVDGPEEVHDRIRGKAGSFAKLRDGIEKVHAAKARRRSRRPSIVLSFTITDLNAGHVVSFLEAAAPLRPEKICISQTNFIDDAIASAHNERFGGDLAVTRSNLGDMDPSRIDAGALAAEFERMDRWVEAHPRAPRIELTPRDRSAGLLARYYHEPLAYVGGRRCTDPFRLVMIKTDGSVIPAHGRCFNYTVGNVGERSLPEIWNGDRFASFRRTLVEAGGSLPACTRCCGVIGKPA